MAEQVGFLQQLGPNNPGLPYAGLPPVATVVQPPKLRFDMSASIGTLIGALAKARKSFKPIIKDATNPFFKSKYADLASVIEATKDGLSDNGLAILQPVAYERQAGLVEVLTVLAHSSGEWMKCSLEMPTAKSDAQGVGSAITYGRRYAYSAVLNVASEQDDDGNAAVSNGFKKAPHAEESNEDFDQRTLDQQCIALFQQKAIQDAMKDSGKTEEDLKTYLDLISHKRLEHVLKSEFQELLKWANSNGKPKPKTLTEVHKQTSELARLQAMKKLFAVGHEHGIPEEDIKKASYEKFDVDSMTKLTVRQLEEMSEWVKSVAVQA